MNIPVLVERDVANGYRARSGEPLPAMAEGATRDEALRNLLGILEERLSQDNELLQLDLKPNEHPFAKYAGKWSPDDPVIQRWKQLVEEYRKQRDDDPDY